MPDPIIATTQLVEETFDEAASGYDRRGLMKERGQHLIDLLGISAGAKVLDVATGKGAVLLPAARRAGPQGHVTGIDISSNMLQQAEQAVATSGLSNIDLLKMDAEHLQFPDAYFDAITCGFGIWFFPPAALHEMYRVCKPGGVIGVTVWGKMPPDSRSSGAIFNQLTKEYRIEVKWSQPASFSPEEVESLLTSHRFVHKKTLRETNEIVTAKAEDLWEGLFSGPNRMLVMSMDEATRARFKEEYLSRLTSIMQPDGLHNIQHVIYSIAQK